MAIFFAGKGVCIAGATCRGIIRLRQSLSRTGIVMSSFFTISIYMYKTTYGQWLAGDAIIV